MYKSKNTLTAGQLIKLLQEVNPDTPIIMENEEVSGTGFTITSVSHYKKYSLLHTCFETYEV